VAGDGRLSACVVDPSSSWTHRSSFAGLKSGRGLTRRPRP